MTLAKHCDGPDCDSWQNVHAVPDMWLVLASEAFVKHFCTPWCALRYLATFAEPTEQIEVPG